jgi:hypothetical protein
MTLTFTSDIKKLAVKLNHTYTIVIMSFDMHSQNYILTPSNFRLRTFE